MNKAKARPLVVVGNIVIVSSQGMSMHHSAGARLVTHRRTVQVLQIDGTQPEVPE